MRTRLLTMFTTGALALCAPAAGAATFTVDKQGDDSAGVCTAAANDCSLRGAFLKANSTVDADVVQLPAGTYLLKASLPELTNDTTVAGAGTRTTVIDGAGKGQQISASDAGPALIVRDLTLRGGAAGGVAAIVGTYGQVLVQRVAVVDNDVGGIFTQSNVRVEDSLIARNTGSSFGAIFAFLTVTLRNTTVTQNLTVVPPGIPAALTYGGGVTFGCLSDIAGSTIADNAVAPGVSPVGANNIAGVGFLCAGASRIRNSIVAGGGAVGNCSSGTTSLGGNVDSDGTCDATGSSDRSEVDPRLAPLADNGGPTDTRALLAGSPALSIGTGCTATDQRGVARPQGGACDAGAYESELTPPAPPAPPAAPVPPTVTVTGPATTVVEPADTTPAKVTLDGLPKTVRRAALAKGLRLTLTSDEPVSVELDLAVAPSRVTIARTSDLTIATAALKRGTGRRTVTVKPKKKLAGKQAVQAQLRIVATDAGGNLTLVTRTFTVK